MVARELVDMASNSASGSPHAVGWLLDSSGTGELMDTMVDGFPLEILPHAHTVLQCPAL